jgi:hypothetical protein
MGAIVVLLSTTASVQAQGLGGLLDNVRRQVESTVRDASNRALSGAGQNNETPAQETPVTPSRVPSEQNGSRADTNHADTPSALDEILSLPEQAPAQNPAASTQDIIKEFETIFLADSDDEGYLTSGSVDTWDFGQKLAIALERDYGISRGCVRQRARDESLIAPTATTLQVAVIMKMLIDRQAPTTRSARQVSSSEIRERIDSLGKPGTGCPSEFGKLKRFLSDFAEASKGMMTVKLERVAARKAEEQRRIEAEQAELARRQQLMEERREAERKQADEERRVRFEREQKRKLELSSGKARPESYHDFRILLEPEDGQGLFRTPSLNPDGKAVQLWGVVHRQEEDGVLLLMEPDVVLVRIDRNTKIVGDLRLRRVVNIIGRHNENAQYGNAFGARKTIAVVDAVIVHAND